MKTKHILALLLAGAVTVGMTACGEDNTNSDDTETGTADTSVGTTDTGSAADPIDYSAGLDENGFFEGVKASDIVKLPSYKGVEIKRSVFTASEKEVQLQIDEILKAHSTGSKNVTDRAVVDGDTLNIDYVGSVDGVEFEGGSTGGAGTEVTIGVTNYIDDFLEQLIGHMPGENFDIEVTFPENYGKDELNGKDAIFNITINHIVEVELPELTDEFAKENYGFDSAEALRKDVEDWVIDNQVYSFVNELLLTAECTEYPESVLKIMVNDDLMQYEYIASMLGITAEEYITTYSDFASIDDYFEEYREDFETNAKVFLAAQAIAEIEGLTITTEDIEALGFGDYIEAYGEPYIKRIALINNVIPNFVKDHAVIVD